MVLVSLASLISEIRNFYHSCPSFCRCYMNSVVQVMLSLPEVARPCLDLYPLIADTIPADPHGSVRIQL